MFDLVLKVGGRGKKDIRDIVEWIAFSSRDMNKEIRVEKDEIVLDPTSLPLYYLSSGAVEAGSSGHCVLVIVPYKARYSLCI